ncbi:4-hydroxy-tetrahydrodipicolinate synthase [Flavobacterium flevense]|uniref:Dihydrodipicolinate synthase family protein n=1 Tax=Flavobacterium flevense TaxID=983 RepID=A0A4Y4AQY3_9FLAO|nr:dihydrodipicolinate synthase family protein [Flavobacterium flevense]GEC70658.1 dihydrodipicolinate synthase family protein [Flavobacterium flevense]SHL50427.1 4-hydroxy-tetrahydrodipicolinate synthase [Flavobacterium flevense]
MNNSKKGFIPVMLTPFNNDGSIDYKTLTDLTELYLKSGVTGLFANCLSSEMFELSETERLQVTKHVVDVVAGQVPIVATGTFEGTIAEQADFTKKIYGTGIDAVILISGLLAKETDSDAVFVDNVHQLLDLTPGIPTGFYECPVPYKRVLTAAQLEDFVNTGRVIYHKDTSLDINQIKAKLSVVKNPDFGLYDAYMVHAIESLKAGSAGLSCIQGNFFPELIVWICDNYNDASKADELAAVQRFLESNMGVMHDVYPVVAKYALQKRGLPISNFTRREVGDFTPIVKYAVDQLQTEYDMLQSELSF